MTNFALMFTASIRAYRTLLLQVGMLVTLYFCSRLAFGLMNPGTVDGPWTTLFAASLRFDLVSVIILNSPLIVLQLFPARYLEQKFFKKAASIYLVTVNAPALLFNCIDAAWFPYTGKRTTADFFWLISTGDDLKNNLTSYLLDYWHVLLFWLVLVTLLILTQRRIVNRTQDTPAAENQRPGLPVRLAAFIMATSLFVLGFRGGTGLKPLSVQSAGSLVPQAAIPLVLNTPFTLIKSWGDLRLEDPDYLTLEQAKKTFDIRQTIPPSTPFRKLNVVVIVLESFSYDYVSYYGSAENTTPFLDSLMRSGACWPYTFANAKRSVEGIPAVTVSLPSLMDQAFISSQYNTTEINSIASLLKPFGYRSGFFHGGTNGTMGFDHFSRLAGYDHYYGKDEFDGAIEDYDGHWGIYDHAYLRFMKRTLDGWKQPFTATFFSLSSHHPYQLPDAYNDRVPDAGSPVKRSIAYTDLALKEFIVSASNAEWFDSTIFVITSDHTGPAASPYSSSRLGAYHIPLVFYSPAIIRPLVSGTTAQQTDILPTVAGLLHYPDTFFAFGRNLLNGGPGWSVSYGNNSWQLVTDNHVLQFDGSRTTGLFTRRDSLLENNLAAKGNVDFSGDERLLKSIIKQYNHGLIHNRITSP